MAVACVLGASSPGLAEDEAAAAKWRLHFGAQATSSWASIYSGFTRPVGGKLYDTGFFFRSTGGGGAYRYDKSRLPRERITGFASFSDLAFGWQKADGPLFYSLAAGISFSSHQLDRSDSGNKVQGTRVGLKLEAGIHYRFAGTWAASANASFGAAFLDWSARGAITRDFGFAAVGIEAGGLGNRGSREFQAGVVAERSFSRLYLKMSGGISLKPGSRPGPYATLAGGYKF